MTFDFIAEVEGKGKEIDIDIDAPIQDRFDP